MPWTGSAGRAARPRSWSKMALLVAPLLLLGLLALRADGCPATCRCYSMTVECGSLGLKEIPASIHPSTQTVFLQDNSITQIHQQDLAALRGLQYLYMQNNTISALEPGAFRSQQHLLELALNGNRIHLLNSSIFKGLEHLRVLYLAGNQITKLLDFTFCDLQRLQELHLQENSIETLEEQALAGLSSLALLDLSKNNLRTISRAALRPLISLQVLRLTANPWRCDCALHWLGAWIKEEGQRLLSSLDKKIVCSEPPRLAYQSLLDISGNSLICIPPVVQVEPLEVTARLGDDLRVSCQASGYPQPLVSWRKVAHVRAGPATASTKPLGRRAELRERGGGERFDSDTGSGMLFLNNITVAHAGKYACEASNPGGTARVLFHLMVNLSQQQPPPPPRAYPASVDVSQEPLYDMESMDFNALSMATQTAIAVGISLLALVALLLIVMIYRKHRKRKKAKKEENILYVNDYSDGPTTFAQLEEYRDERGHEMFVIDRTKPLFATYKDPEGLAGAFPGLPEPLQDQATQTLEGEEEGEREASELFVNQGLAFQPQIAYEIHC
ncbi:leucine-rich repeat-containing protein 24 isoform X1 [Mauremys reevesii]|uniref:leucine-rich repeat-containing protein 24 isoform X1 n=2 Tax=Mauremys reevesii TaxID=260615 RepID=UPI001940189B|nr:leucine-rich repeat-containing protein 24 isoform X1 [Mauremys reevesii]